MFSTPLPEFFLKDYQNFHEVFPDIFQFFFSKFQQILLKTNSFFSFSLYFLDSPSVPYWHFIKLFGNFSIFFFKDLLKILITLQLKFSQIFILVYLKILQVCPLTFLYRMRHKSSKWKNKVPADAKEATKSVPNTLCGCTGSSSIRHNKPRDEWTQEAV